MNRRAKQKRGKARIAVKTKARRAGAISQAKPARPPARLGRELNNGNADDERCWLDW